ncbi:MAG TPA: hypothetical protein VF178_14360 [Gemmatimonadaceae bacterium]
MSSVSFLSRARRLAGPALVALALPVVSGCYRLTPIDTSASPDEGTEVRIDLTDEGSVRLAPLVGPRIEAIDGRAIGTTDTSMVLAVTEAVTRTGYAVPWNGERLEVPRTAIGRLHARQLDRGRTWLVSGASVAGIILLSQIFDWSGGDDVIPARGPIGGPAESRVPVPPSP